MVALLLGTVASIVLYRPDASLRLVTIKDYQAEEQHLVTYVHNLVPEGKKMLFFHDDTKVYWLAHRLPPKPLINTDVKTGRGSMRNQPQRVLDRLDDPDLVLVEFNPDKPAITDEAFLMDPSDALFLKNFNKN